MTIGVAIGGTGTFVVKPIDKNGNSATLPAGVIPGWSASDPAVTISPAADGLTAVVAVPMGDSGTSFTLTVTATMPDATKPTGTLLVPLVRLEVASLVISQTA